MRFVRISEIELSKIRSLYESVMAHASYGLFYREGETLGKEIVEMAGADSEDFLETAGRLIKARGWAEGITFAGDRVIATGSIEASEGAREATCHRLRGMVHAIMEAHTGGKLVCVESRCVSLGDPHCEFTLKNMEGN